METLKVSRLYKDFDMSFGVNAVTGDVNKKLDVNAVKQSVRNLLLTNLFERPFQPLLGSSLRGLLFEPMTMVTALSIEKSVSNLLKAYEPRAELINIKANPQYDKNSYELSVTFKVVGFNSPEILTQTLQRLR